jgi:hypothetical protein
MINIWYPKEIGAGVEVKEVLNHRNDFNQLGSYLNRRLNVGHSSILLDQVQRPVYLSWWPQAPATRTPTWGADVAEEGGNPDVMCAINSLDELAIAGWWSKLVAARTGPRGGYDFVSYNCSSVVADALTAGGAERFAPRPSLSMWTPSRIEDWAEEIIEKSPGKTNRVFRHEGISNFIDNALRRNVSEIGAKWLTK